MADDPGARPAPWLPRFIEDVAADRDAFGAHGRIAKAIAELVQSTHGLKVIGLLGPWGSGKSTVARLVEKAVSERESDSKTYFFTYDTWIHQSDPPRRAFLEALIYFLTHADLTKLHLWKKKLDELNRRTETTETTSTPTLTTAGRWIGASLLLVPIGLPFIGYEWFSATYGNNWLERLLNIELPPAAKIIYPIALTLTAAPLVVSALLYFSWRPKAWPWTGGFWKTHREPHADESIVSIFANKEISRNTMTISRGIDPTAIEFQVTFRDIINRCSIEKPRFVFVIDNLDRLPETDAIAMWSTIRSFFLGGEELDGGKSESNQPIIILPIDERAVARMYSASQQDPKVAIDLAQSFMDKTFDLTFRVPPPVLSDWSGYFETQLKSVFEERVAEDDVFNITTILRHYIDSHPSLEVTPRFINTLINLFATIWMQWHDQISFASISYFCIHRATIEVALLGELGSPKGGIENIDPEWQQSIAAMHYGVAQLSDALQIIMDGPLANAVLKNDKPEFERLAAVRGFDWAFQQALTRASGDGVTTADPQFALLASSLIEPLNASMTNWVKRQRVMLRKIFINSGTWKNLETVDVVLIAGFLGKVPRTEVRTVAQNLAEKLGAIDPANLGNEKGMALFTAASNELSKFCRANQLNTVRVQAPGTAETYVRLLGALDQDKFLLQLFNPRGTNAEISAYLLNGLSSKESAQALPQQLSALVLAEVQISYLQVAEMLLNALVDRPVADFAFAPAVDALSLIHLADARVQTAVKARVENSQLGAVHAKLLNANLSDEAATLLGLIMASGSAVATPLPLGGSWADFLSKHPQFVLAVDNSIRRCAGETTLDLVVNAAQADQGLIPMANGIFSHRITARSLGRLRLKTLVETLPRYTAFVDPELLEQFFELVATYESFNEYVAAAPLTESLTAMLTLLISKDDARALPIATVVKSKLSKLSEAEWSTAISEEGLPFQLGRLLATHHTNELPLGAPLMNSVDELAKVFANSGTPQQLSDWFEATSWLSESSTAVLFMNLRDLLVGGSIDSRAAKILAVAPTEFVAKAKFEEKADDAIRHVILPLLSSAEGLVWLRANSQSFLESVRRAQASGPALAVLIERLGDKSSPIFDELRLQWNLPTPPPSPSEDSWHVETEQKEG